MTEVENTVTPPDPAKDLLIEVCRDSGWSKTVIRPKTDFDDEEFRNARMLEGVTVTNAISAKRLGLINKVGCAGVSVGCLSVILGVGGGAALAISEQLVQSDPDIVTRSLNVVAAGLLGGTVGGLIGVGGLYVSITLTEKVLEKLRSSKSTKSSLTTSLAKFNDR